MLEKYQRELETKGETYLRIKARPGADATELKGILETQPEETLKIDIAAPPEQGRANEELIHFLATAFQTNRQQVSIISGAGEKIKLIKIKKT